MRTSVISFCVAPVGAKIHDALETGVSKYPEHEGRFPQVAGLRFTLDPSKPAGDRVNSELVTVDGEKLDLNKVSSCSASSGESMIHVHTANSCFRSRNFDTRSHKNVQSCMYSYLYFDGTFYPVIRED